MSDPIFLKPNLTCLVFLQILLTIVVYFSIFYKHVLCRLLAYFLSTKTGQKFTLKVVKPVKTGYEKFFAMKFSSAIVYVVVTIIFVVFLIIDTADDRRRLMSAFGIVILVSFFLSYFLSWCCLVVLGCPYLRLTVLN